MADNQPSPTRRAVNSQAANPQAATNQQAANPPVRSGWSESEPSGVRRFDTVLVANRGEIAVRVIRTLRELGIRAVAVHSDADTTARHVAEADVAVRIGPRAATESYLNVDRVIEAAVSCGAQAVHPGYGFLSESAAFAAACAEAGLAFIGPSAGAIESMGDKIRAKRTVADAGVPLVPGSAEEGATDEELRRAALETGLPVLFKPSAGGGGKGMRLVHHEHELDQAITAARRESRAAFGDDTMFVERFVTRPRHIEVQILGDSHGHVVHLGERECSLQRRHQKIIEEAPSPLLDAATRARIGGAAVDAAKAVGYVGAGTVEFIVSADRPDEFFFMEMNTRLQVEHPVTELVTVLPERSGIRPAEDGAGIDLVAWQVRIAEGEPFPYDQHELGMTGHAVEARVYAEDPARGFLPTGGEILHLREPGGTGVRVDSGIATGSVVGSDYDPMLAKVIAHASNRSEALRRLDGALAGTSLLGPVSNLVFLRALLNRPEVRSGELDTGLVDRELANLVGTEGTRERPPEDVLIAAAAALLLAEETAAESGDPWDTLAGWRLGGPGWMNWRFAVDGDRTTVWIRGGSGAAEVVVDPGGELSTRHRLRADRNGRVLTVTLDDRTRRYDHVVHEDTVHLAEGGAYWALTEHTLLADAARDTGAADGAVVSPMPGTVLVSNVEPEQRVASGQPLFVVEAMKMEHTVVSPVDGTVTEVRVTAGQTVDLEQSLAVVTADEDTSRGE
ncbi:acetyl-CoA/propionyl-CoA carboxylase, biotin carboxylase, biotin carboxyl carrier protein [Actinopolyspora alba]|uniref:Biotin-dependent 3-methylcrotonyl-coenzyme A carboxylase alpha1 subunit n=1 Tax=Actinopolyspora alba TaxID=673379 RepID=A0A1I1WIH2_9ACTN|nr:biotin carboxylase N-terminal domain-containing protein [Actinopolyspora alba]SFD94946.1 acetyl-CoA/propionyl-CoA carboxylase, biotin carboxylase, biotin carboxyl carrier protein [Actinopolyspora alba]